MPPLTANAARHSIRLTQHGEPCLLLSACYCRTLPPSHHRAPHARSGGAISHPSAQRRQPMSSSSALQRGYSHKSSTHRTRPPHVQLKQMLQTLGPLRMPSTRVSMQKVAEMDNFTDDMGIMAGTLVMPKGIYSWSFLISQPRFAIQMQWDRLIKRAKDFATTIVVWRFAQKPRLKIGPFKIVPTAKELHKQMYTAFADGDIAYLKEFTTEGLRSFLSARINQRPRIPSTGRPERYEWTLHRYLGFPGIVSHRAAQLPGISHGELTSVFRQAVVRIRSEQSLRRVPADAAALGGAEAMKAVDQHDYVWRGVSTEYLVLQKRVMQGVEEPWKVYGTVQETKIEDWESTIRPPVVSDQVEAT